MADERGNWRSLWLLLPRQLRELPADLAAVLILIALTNLVVIVPIVKQTPVRVVVSLPFLLFLPGYVFVAALFPESGSSQAKDEDTGAKRTGGGIDGIERAVLSVGLSIAIIPAIGLLLNFTPFGIRLQPILAGVTGFTVVFTVLAVVRRNALPEDERFRVPYQTWGAATREEVFDPETRLDGLLNVALVVSLVLAIGVLSFAIMMPPDGEAFTEFYLLTETDDGELVMDDYPSEFIVGESQSTVVAIGNQENQPMEYTVVVQLQTVGISGNETTVLERQEIDRFESPLIADNETWHTDHEITVTMTGQNLRLQYLLYRGEPPATPTVENAYRNTHLWIDVSEI
jgi:uncharacterized membrane protein